MGSSVATAIVNRWSLEALMQATRFRLETTAYNVTVQLPPTPLLQPVALGTTPKHFIDYEKPEYVVEAGV